MKLITDITSTDFSEIKLLKENGNDRSAKDGYTYITGIYAQADVKNGNGRIYPHDELAREVAEFDKSMIQTGRALSELEHPTEATINPQRACSRILEMHEDNGSWVGKSVILATNKDKGILGTPCGDIVKSLLTFGTKLGHSTRAVGNVDDETGIVSDMKLITCDVVTNPSIGIMNNSNANRFVNGILESKDFMLNTHGEIVETPYKKLAKRLGKMPNTAISSKKNAYLVNAVNEFLEHII